MSDTPETLSSILVEMRRANFQPQFYQRCIDEYADRIEAAAERERIQRDKVSFRCGDCAEFGGDCDAGDVDGNEDCIACEKFRRRAAPGNAAALREALETVRDLLHSIAGSISPEFCASLADESKAKIRAALAAPARNCDRPECATAEGAIAALRANPCANHDFCKEQLDCAECATRWLLAKAEGGAK